jgi:hypothetical protein
VGLAALGEQELIGVEQAQRHIPQYVGPAGEGHGVMCSHGEDVVGA